MIIEAPLDDAVELWVGRAVGRVEWDGAAVKLFEEGAHRSIRLRDEESLVRFDNGEYQMLVHWRAQKSEEGEGEVDEVYIPFAGECNLVNSTMLRLAGPGLLTLVRGDEEPARAPRRAVDIAMEETREAQREWKLSAELKGKALAACS